MAEQTDTTERDVDRAYHASAGRERNLTEAFVSIANSLVQGYDIVDLYSGLTRDCVRLLDISSAGLLLADRAGVLQVVGASSEAAHNLELFVLQSKEGPCLDCFVSDAPVSEGDLRRCASRWPQFVPAALAAGIESVHALPMRLQDTTLGVLGLFGGRAGVLHAEDLMLGQALAHVASIALVAERLSTDKSVINDQLQTALTSRVVLEQAKGILSQLGGIDMEHAFAALRRYSRDHNRRVSDIAEAIVSRALPPSLLIEHGRARGILGEHSPR